MFDESRFHGNSNADGGGGGGRDTLLLRPILNQQHPIPRSQSSSPSYPSSKPPSSTFRCAISNLINPLQFHQDSHQHQHHHRDTGGSTLVNSDLNALTSTATSAAIENSIITEEVLTTVTGIKRTSSSDGKAILPSSSGSPSWSSNDEEKTAASRSNGSNSGNSEDAGSGGGNSGNEDTVSGGSGGAK